MRTYHLPVPGTKGKNKKTSGGRRTSDAARSPKASAPEAAAVAVSPPGGGGRMAACGGAVVEPPNIWGSRAAGEPVTTYSSRLRAHLHEYTEAAKQLRRLQEELRGARNIAKQRLPTPGRAEASATVERLKGAIKTLEDRRAEILAGSGPLEEKLLNGDRFRALAGGSTEGSGGPHQVEEEEDDGEPSAPYPPEGLVSSSNVAQAPYSGIAPEQVALPPDSSNSEESGSEGEDGSGGSSSEGGCLILQQVRQIESPERFGTLLFGDEICEDGATGRGAKRRRKKARASSAVDKLVYVPFSGAPPPRSTEPATHPGSGPVVGPQRGSGESKACPDLSSASSGGSSDSGSDMECGPGENLGNGVRAESSVAGRTRPAPKGVNTAGAAPPAASAGVSRSPTYGSTTSGSLSGARRPVRAMGKTRQCSVILAPLEGSVVRSGSSARRASNGSEPGAPPPLDAEGEWPALVGSAVAGAGAGSPGVGGPGAPGSVPGAPVRLAPGGVASPAKAPSGPGRKTQVAVPCEGGVASLGAVQPSVAAACGGKAPASVTVSPTVVAAAGGGVASRAVAPPTAVAAAGGRGFRDLAACCLALH